MKITTKYSKGGKAVGVKKKSATMHIPATPAGSNKARIAAIGTPKKSGTKAAVVMEKGGTKKPLKKAQTGQTVKTPFQEYLTIPGTTPSDTIYSTGKDFVTKTKSKPILNQAYELTYGQDYNQVTDYPNWKKELERRRGSHSGYSNSNNPYRKNYSAKVAAEAAKKKASSTTKKAKGGPVKSKKK